MPPDPIPALAVDPDCSAEGATSLRENSPLDASTAVQKLAQSLSLRQASTLVSGPATLQMTAPALRILLVEDHVDTCQMMARLLMRCGFAVHPVGTVAEAIAVGTSCPFELLVADIGLPDGSGCDVMRALAVRLRGIAVSGYGRADDIRRSQDAGFVAHLIKPVDFELLATAVREAVAMDLPSRRRAA